MLHENPGHPYDTDETFLILNYKLINQQLINQHFFLNKIPPLCGPHLYCLSKTAFL